MDETVNDSPIFEASDFDSVANESYEEQAVEDGGNSAVEDSVEQSTSQDTATDSADTTDVQTGDAIDEFLAKKGIKSDDPDALRKVADMYRNVEKSFNQKAQEKAQLERQLTQSRIPEMRPEQEALSQVKAIKTEMEVERWKAQRNLAPEAEQKMMEFIASPITDVNGQVQTDMNGNPISKGALVLNGILSLDDVYRLAGCEEIKVDDLKEQMRAEVRKEMVARQTAKRPVATATDSSQFSKAEEHDDFLEGFLG